MKSFLAAQSLIVALTAIPLFGSATRVNATTTSFTATGDTTLVQAGGFAIQNFNAAGFIAVGGLQGGAQYSVLRFDVSSLGALPVQVNSAILRLTVQQVDGTPTYQPEVHAITTANIDWLESEASFADRKTSTPWSGSPYYDPTVLKGLSLPGGSLTVGQVIDFTFTGDQSSLINNWRVSDLASTPNAGLVLLDPTWASYATGGLTRIRFYERENLTSTLRPQLIIDYTVLPEPSSLGLLLMGSIGLWRLRRKR